jgi:hypothetical protein
MHDRASGSGARDGGNCYYQEYVPAPYHMLGRSRSRSLQADFSSSNRNQERAFS